MRSSLYPKMMSVLLAVWFVFALTASAFHLFHNAPDAPPIALGLAAGGPVIAFLVWFWVSPSLRQFALALNPRTLTFLQSWRIAGYTFLVLYFTRLLPGVFALPAGWGDVAIGITAPFAAVYLANSQRKGSFVVWQLLGIADLVTAVALGGTAGLIHPDGIQTTLMTVLPLSMIPTFAVPLCMIFHIICIAQASVGAETLRWSEATARTREA
jgi:hypothetical protein